MAEAAFCTIIKADVIREGTRLNVRGDVPETMDENGRDAGTPHLGAILYKIKQRIPDT
jgi:hypothetical protein